jgi:hypothetical protein
VVDSFRTSTKLRQEILNDMAQNKKIYDAIIVGSRAAGGLERQRAAKGGLASA